MMSNGIKNGTMLLFTTASQDSRLRKPVGGEAAPNVDPLGHGHIMTRDGGVVVAAIMGGLGCYHFGGKIRVNTG